MKKISLITFNFGEYDKIRTHFLSSQIEHIYISDHAQDIIGWKPVVFNKFNDAWKNSLYVRYHPFEFSNSEIVIVIDGSLSIQEGVDCLIEQFLNSDSEIGLLLSHQYDLRGRISRWINNGRLSDRDKASIFKIFKESGKPDYKGVIAACFKIFRNTQRVKDYLNRCWEVISSNGMIRLDEIPSSLALEEFKDLRIMPFSTSLIQGDAFLYRHHHNDSPFRLSFDKEQFWMMNKPVKPVYVGNAYSRKFEYRTEAMCLTRFFTESELRFWINYHLRIGFDHIHIFDNESQYDCKSVCLEYGDSVSYEFISGGARHYKIFDSYVNSDNCKSEWIIPIDDDEYFELNTNICNNVYECLDWYISKFPDSQMFAIRWKHLFPKKFHSECTTNILEYCTEENKNLASKFQTMGDRGIKTFVRRSAPIHYEEREENPFGGHVPSHNLCNGARLYNGQIIKKCSCSAFPKEPNEPARLIHCRYKGYSWYKTKNKDILENKLCLDNNSGLIYTKDYKFNEILEELE